MAFSSVQFLFIFLPLSLAVYWLLPKALRNGALGAFSLLFFAWAGLKGAAILLALAAITWLGGLLLEKLPRKKPLLILLIAAHLAVLAAFKYAGFAARSINALRGRRRRGTQRNERDCGQQRLCRRTHPPDTRWP